jgi:hypothetical protein
MAESHTGAAEYDTMVELLLQQPEIIICFLNEEQSEWVKGLFMFILMYVCVTVCLISKIFQNILMKFIIVVFTAIFPV